MKLISHANQIDASISGVIQSESEMTPFNTMILLLLLAHITYGKNYTLNFVSLAAITQLHANLLSYGHFVGRFFKKESPLS